MNKIKSCGLLTVSAGLLMLAACGDENTTNNYDNTAIESYTEKSLPDCTKENEGKLAYLKTDETLRVCYDAEWYVISGKDGEKGATGDKGDQGDKGDTGDKGKTGKSGDNGTGCTVTTLADSTGLKLTCDGDSIGIILNGKPGDKGDDGEKGNDCIPCTTEALADDAGYKIVCGGDSVAVVLNGKVLAASPASSSANNTSPVVKSSSSKEAETPIKVSSSSKEAETPIKVSSSSEKVIETPIATSSSSEEATKPVENSSSSKEAETPIATSSSSEEAETPIAKSSSSEDKPIIIECKQFSHEEKDAFYSKNKESNGNVILPGNFGKLKESLGKDAFELEGYAWEDVSDCAIKLVWTIYLTVVDVSVTNTQIANAINEAAEGSGLFNKGAYTLAEEATISHYDGCSQDGSYCIDVDYGSEEVSEIEGESFLVKNVYITLKKKEYLK